MIRTVKLDIRKGEYLSDALRRHGKEKYTDTGDTEQGIARIGSYLLRDHVSPFFYYHRTERAGDRREDGET